MKNNVAAFQFLSWDESVPIGYKKISLHMGFDVHMAFAHKAWLVAGGHITDVLHSLTYIMLLPITKLENL
jgi:hypothetical protein